MADANGDDDHGAPPQSAAKGASAAPIRTAERNIQTEVGQFKVRLRQTPADPRAGEEAQFAVDLSEQVEGGFGGAGMQPLEGATVTARVMTAAGQAVADKLATHAEPDGSYGVHYAFNGSGEYKIIFDARTSDGRQFSADFPVSVVSAPTNWLFWLGLAALGLVSAGAIFGYYNSWKRGDAVTANVAARKTVPVAIAALVFFGLGTAALAYFAPPRERRAIAHLPPASGTEAGGSSTAASTGDPTLGGSGATITIPKESQLLFSIRTAPVTQRQITGGLKVAGVVRARPDAQAVVSPPVSGRVLFNQGLTIGTVVGRGQRIGTIEQILGAPEQAGLEAQRIGLRTAALEQQARQAEQNALAQQARTRQAQARRELQRATNLLEAGAAPRRRVEEAQTAVRLAEQEVTSAEQQARVAAQQVRVAQEGVSRVDPVRTFPLVSPVTGIVSELKVTSGQQVEAGAQLMNVVNLTTVFLEAQVFERDLAAVRESRRASYTAAGIPGEVYRIGEGGDGRLVTIGQTVDPQKRTVPVIYEVPNPLNRLRDGMFVEIAIDTTGSQTILGVPKASVITEQGRTFVFVFKGGETYEKRVVVLGAEGQDF
ncbi:MAG: efflux RND transporter periplasmic adaptor subunit, partial [Acidobacteriota bacterium]|nr:efflux RND transporter periplasmic adaptor subunit [Acidobacteriota bacterium]